MLDDKFYTQFKTEDGSDWMYDKVNSNALNGLMSEYYTDVTEFSYNEAKKVYDIKQQEIENKNIKKDRAANYIIGGQSMRPSTFNATYGTFINNISNPKEGDLYASPSGRKFKYQNGKFLHMTGVNEYNTDNPLTFKDVAVLDGWDNYVTYEKPEPQ